MLNPDTMVSSHANVLKVDTITAALTDAKRYRVDARTGWPGVSILKVVESVSLICSIHLSVAVRAIA